MLTLVTFAWQKRKIHVLYVRNFNMFQKCVLKIKFYLAMLPLSRRDQKEEEKEIINDDLLHLYLAFNIRKD